MVEIDMMLGKGDCFFSHALADGCISISPQNENYPTLTKAHIIYHHDDEEDTIVE